MTDDKKESKLKEKVLSMLEELQPDFDFRGGTDFVESGYLDSFDVIQLVSMIEKKFSVIISALDILPENFNSVDSICKLIERSKKRKSEQTHE